MATGDGAYHGGGFWEAIGPDFAALDRRDAVISADVLDAWFPPSPRVVEAVHPHLEWLMRTSPPTKGEGLVEAIANARGLPSECIAAGAGSSSLIFNALRLWMKPGMTALIPEPTYGEYRHVLERMLGVTVRSFPLGSENDFSLDVDAFIAEAQGANLVVLVNPNSPNGRALPAQDVGRLADGLPASTTLWIDETYIDYAGELSFENEAASRPNVVVVKSMSKVYALSGLRVGYLVAGQDHIEALRRWTPPWAVDLIAQVAATVALHDRNYYEERYAETRALRASLRAEVETRLGWRAFSSQANFLLFELPPSGPDALELDRRAREQGLYIRAFPPESGTLGPRFVRLAVKPADVQRRMVDILCGIV